MRRAVLLALLGAAALLFGPSPTVLGQTPLECGQVASGSLSNPLGKVFYAFGALAGDRVTIRLVRTSGAFQPLLELYSPTGSRLDYSMSSTASLDDTLSAAGIYTVAVSDYNQKDAGAFRLTFQKPNNPCNSTSFSCGQIVQGTLDVPMRINAHVFAGSAGDVVTLRSVRTSGSFQTFLELFGPDGRSVNYSVSSTATVDATLPSTGSYTVFASDYNRTAMGSYALVYQKTKNPCSAKPLTCGTIASGSLAVPLQRDLYTFSGNAGDVLTLRSVRTSGSFQTFLELFGPDGRSVNYSVSSRATVDATLPFAGSYTVFVSDYNRLATGGYSLLYQKTKDPCSSMPLACGQPLNGSLTTPLQMDFYTLSGKAGDKITVRVAQTAGSFQTLLEVFGPDGRSVNYSVSSNPSLDLTLPTAGTYVAAVSDYNRTGTGNYSVLWNPTAGPCTPSTYTLTVTPASLSFSGATGAAVAVPQQLELRSTLPGLPWLAAARTQSGGNWLSVFPTVGQAPAVLQVSVDATSLAPGSYSGSIDISAPGATPSSASIPVSLTVGTQQAASLLVRPGQLSFRLPAGGNAPQQTLSISNSGGGTLRWSAQAATVSGNWLSVSATSGQATANQPATLQISVNSSGLAVGSYAGSIGIQSPDTNQTATVPVDLSVQPTAAVLLLSQSALLFHAVEGAGTEPAQTFGVINVGSGGLDWTAQAVIRETSPWLRLAPATGRSDAGSSQVPLVTVSVDPTGLKAGLYSGLVRVTAPGANNSPQVLRVDLQVLPQGTKLGAVVRPTGLIFVAAAGGSVPAAQDISVATHQGAPVAFINAPIGGDWIDRSPDSGTTTRDAPGRITVQAKTGSLAAGTYRGGLTVLTQDDGALYPVNVLLLVLPAGSATSGVSEPRPLRSTPIQSAACTAGRLLLQIDSVFMQFNATVGWPSVLRVNVRDDCGNAAAGGTVVVSFSNGDPSALLNDLGNGQYHGTWRPNSTQAQVVLTAQALWRGLQGQTTATALISPYPNSLAAIFNQGGVVLGAGFEPGPVAPGSIVSLFGKNLASIENFAASVPLPRTLGGVRVLVGDQEAPLFYAGPGQVNMQVPFELGSGRQLQVLIETNGVASAPEPIQTAANRPGIFTLGGSFGKQGAILIANTNRLAMPVTAGIASEPAAAGTVVSIYCTGLGQTEPAAASGEAGPASPLAAVRTAVSVTIGGQPAKVSFAGLAPGLVGVYQINAEVPAGTQPGDAVPVLITQGGFASNTATIAVK